MWDATIGAAQKILEFKNLLTEVLAGAMDVMMAIIEDPIGFLKNLIAGIMGGLNLFKDNIVEHLKGGLMGWLVGSLESTGMEMPTSFDLKGIFQLVFGIWSAIWTNRSCLLTPVVVFVVGSVGWRFNMGNISLSF